MEQTVGILMVLVIILWIEQIVRIYADSLGYSSFLQLVSKPAGQFAIFLTFTGVLNILSCSPVEAAQSSAVVSSCVSLPPVTEGTQVTFRQSCAVTVNNNEHNLKLGVMVDNLHPLNRTGGMQWIKLTSPVNRMEVINTETGMGGEIRNIFAPVMVAPNAISGVYRIEVRLKTFEADCGNMSYSLRFYPVLIKNANEFTGSNYGYFYFTTPVRQSVSVSADPAIVLKTLGDVFSFSRPVIEGVPITVYVKSNIPWKLQSRLDTDPVTGSLLSVPAKYFCFKCDPSVDFACLARDYKTFAAAGSYYDAAGVIPGRNTTGSPDGVNLATTNVVLTYGLKMEKVFLSGRYNTKNSFRLQTPGAG